ncbi:MAG TPA: glycosyltransferase family 4 protein [Anaerolineales bacterium]|nr:glycosyltransferase family 4 protein [Anaerolineales bacterium]
MESNFSSPQGLQHSSSENETVHPRIPNGEPPFSGKKLRLLYVSNPNSIHTRRWVSWFAKRGHMVCLLADVPPKGSWSEVQVIDLSKFFYAPIIRFPIWAIWLRRFIHQWRPDILHAHRVNSAGWLAAAAGFHPLVVTPWGSDVMLGPQRSRLLNFLARFTLRGADKVTVSSQAISEKVLELGASEESLVKIYYGVDLNIFSPRPTSRQENVQQRRQLSFPEVGPLIFSPRAIHPIYNQDILLQAVPLVLKRFPTACFFFVAFNVNVEYKQELDRIIDQLGLGGSVRWLPATSSPADMVTRYNLSDIVVSIPSSDGAPVTVMEAMACGKPLICSDLPALRESITNGENGWIVPVRQVSPLAEAIIRALEQPDQAAQIGRKARQLVTERANLEVEMQRMEAVYYQLAGFTKD